MDNTWFNVPEKEQPRIATIYNRTPTGLKKPAAPLRIGSPAYFSGAGGQMCIRDRLVTVNSTYCYAYTTVLLAGSLPALFVPSTVGNISS